MTNRPHGVTVALAFSPDRYGSGHAFYTRAVTMPEHLGPFRAGPGGVAALPGRAGIRASRLPGVRGRSAARASSSAGVRALRTARQRQDGAARLAREGSRYGLRAGRAPPHARGDSHRKRCSSSACFRCRGGNASRRKGSPSTEPLGGRARAVRHRWTLRWPLARVGMACPGADEVEVQGFNQVLADLGGASGFQGAGGREALGRRGRHQGCLRAEASSEPTSRHSLSNEGAIRAAESRSKIAVSAG